MLRRRLTVLVAIVLFCPVATSAPSGGAVEPDLVVSATSGPARSVIEVSSASCVDEPDNSIWRSLSARLVSGAPGSEVMAGAGSTRVGESVRLVVPDWIDPADPAQIVAVCWELETSFEGPEEDPPTAVAYDSVAFDVLDPTEPAVQSVAYSRTALATGQGFRTELTGCFLEGSLRVAGTEVLSGSDLTGGTGEGVAFSDTELDGTDAAVVSLLLNNSRYSYGWSVSEGERPVIDLVQEEPSDIAPGPHAAFPYCAALSDAGVTYLFFPPSPIDVTGTSPMSDIELRTSPGSRDVVLDGGCDQPSADGVLTGDDLEADDPGFLRTGRVADVTGSSLGGPVLRPTPVDPGLQGDPRRAIAGDQVTITTFSAVPDADGRWSAEDTADFDLGLVAARTTCGDPYGDGFSYDIQIAAIDVPPPVEPTTTTSTVTTTAPPAPPAQGVPGTPSYAG